MARMRMLAGDVCLWNVLCLGERRLYGLSGAQ